MGVVHMLVVALVGITYGWQSDDNGGVEYIVQISPTELREIDRLGEITSSIDPAVAGHVSRIKIRVGTGTLPRETPDHLSAPSSRPNLSGIETASDRVAVPIPQMREQDLATPIRSPDQHDLALSADGSWRAKASMMKPDPDSAGPGFPFPSTVGNTTSDTAEGFRSDLDRAGRAIGGRGQNMLQDPRDTATFPNSLGAPNRTARLPAPGTRQPDPLRQPSMPQFTNGRSATALPGGPTTDPANARDQRWSNIARPRLGGPTTDAVGADRTRANDPRFSGSGLNDPRSNDPRNSLGGNAARSSGGSSNRTSSGTFGQAPGGMTFPNRNAQTDPGRMTDRRMTTDRSSQPNDSSNRFNRDRVTSQQQQMELDRQNRLIPSVEFATDPALRDRPQGPLLRNTAGSQNTEPRDPRFRNEPTRVPNESPRFRNESIAQNDPRRDPRTNLDDRYGGRQPGATLEQPMTIRTAPNFVRGTRQNEPSDLRGTRAIPYQQPGVRQSANTPDFAPNGVDRPTIAPEPNQRRNQARDPISLTKRDASMDRSSATNPIAQTARNHIAAQPLFNGLLLMSFVANIYLMFWLKNLRLRFRDLVAAKRLAGSSNQAS